jgi:hypothetical protein
VAAQAEPGSEFTHEGRAYRRTDSSNDRRLEQLDGIRPVRVTDLSEGRTFNVAAAWPSGRELSMSFDTASQGRGSRRRGAHGDTLVDAVFIRPSGEIHAPWWAAAALTMVTPRQERSTEQAENRRDEERLAHAKQRGEPAAECDEERGDGLVAHRLGGGHPGHQLLRRLAHPVGGEHRVEAVPPAPLVDSVKPE